MILCLMVDLILRVLLTATSNDSDSDSDPYSIHRQITLSVFLAMYIVKILIDFFSFLHRFLFYLGCWLL